MIARIGLALGPALAGVMLLSGGPAALPADGWVVLCVLALMVVWWVTEAVPIPVTAMVPLALLPTFTDQSAREVAGPYADPIIFLFIGGFMLALSVERWGLHRRVALALIGALGTQPRALVAGFMLASALLSMWISNTATSLMLMPIAIGVARALAGPKDADPVLGGALVLGVAYAASIGGTGTPVGSPTNLIAMGWLEGQGLSIGFGQWMMMALPLTMLLLLLCWLVLVRPLGRSQTQGMDDDVARLLDAERASLGKLRVAEQRVMLVFGAVALGWMLRELLSALPGLSGISDMSIAVAGAILLFVIPSAERGARLMDWETATRIPWGIALLFGGGLSMAAAMDSAGVTAWLGAALSGAGMLAPVLVVMLLAGLVIFATELTSNVATLSAFLPVIGAVALASGIDPLLLVFPASIAASLAFMMPIGTAPNAIAFASGFVTIPRMVRVGLVLNLLAIVAVTAMSELIVPRVLGS